MHRRLYPNQDDPSIGHCLENLAGVLQGQGRYSEAELVYRDIVEFHRKLHGTRDHPGVVQSLNKLGWLLLERGKSVDAELIFKESLEMTRRLCKDQDSSVTADAMNSLASVQNIRKKFAEAEPLCLAAIEMHKRLYRKENQPALAAYLNNLAGILVERGKDAEATLVYSEALEITKRAYPQYNHPDVPRAMNNLANSLKREGKFAEAETLFTTALNTIKQLYPKYDHPEVARSLHNLATGLWASGKYADAEVRFREALKMYRALVTSQAESGAEGDALTQAASQPLTRDWFLSNARLNKSDPATVYAEVWADKSAIAREAERRALRARAVTNPKAAAILSELRDVRYQRSQLLLAPMPADAKDVVKRDTTLDRFARRITELNDSLRPLLPVVERLDKLDKSTFADLQQALPADAVFVDFLSYVHFELDRNKPGKDGEKWTKTYVAFVVTKTAVHWIDLKDAAPIERAVGLWREAITTSPYVVATDLPARVRERVWEPIRKVLPPRVKVVYVSPDAALTGVPWAALPGGSPGTILLEDHAVAVVPHGPFLLGSLWPRPANPDRPVGLLAIGGISYDAEPVSAGGSEVALSRGTRGELPIDPAKQLAWSNLPGTKAEADQILRRAAGRKLTTRSLAGAEATAERVLAELPNARNAHIGTHGFFADPSFRSSLQVDPKLFETARFGQERVGHGAINSMVMSGLVFAGANRVGTPGRGIVTGEALLDRDLSGLELAVLSACETGLGDVAGGEGVFGLQRAFHVAGTRNVVASLWKVNDEVTAALIGEFFRQQWEMNLPPVEALRQAQLAVYRADPKDFRAMAFRGIEMGDIKNPNIPMVGPPLASGKSNPPVLWAAFTLSGVGR